MAGMVETGGDASTNANGTGVIIVLTVLVGSAEDILPAD
jgi:hypothetical protein